MDLRRHHPAEQWDQYRPGQNDALLRLGSRSLQHAGSKETRYNAPLENVKKLRYTTHGSEGIDESRLEAQNVRRKRKREGRDEKGQTVSCRRQYFEDGSHRSRGFCTKSPGKGKRGCRANNRELTRKNTHTRTEEPVEETPRVRDQLT